MPDNLIVTKKRVYNQKKRGTRWKWLWTRTSNGLFSIYRLIILRTSFFSTFCQTIWHNIVKVTWIPSEYPVRSTVLFWTKREVVWALIAKRVKLGLQPPHLSIISHCAFSSHCEYSTQQYYRVEFLFKLFDRMTNKIYFLKSINLYHQEEVCGSHQSIYAFPAEATGTL